MWHSLSLVYHVAQFVTGLILYPIFCFFGLTGNCLTLVILRSRKLGGVMSAFLAALAVSDIVKLRYERLPGRSGCL